MIAYVVSPNWPVAAEQAAAPVSSGANAETLVKQSRKSVAYVVKLARASKDPALALDSKDGRPFWQAVKKLNEAVDKAERGLFLKDETFFRALGDSVSAVVETSVAFEMSGAKDEKVETAIRKADKIIRLVDKTYGKSAALQARGGGLSAAEQEQFKKMKAKQAELQKKLTEMEKKVGKNSKAIEGIKLIQKESQRISTSRDSLGDFIAALVAVRIIDGLIFGWHWWWGPWGAWAVPFCFTYVDVYYESIDVVDYDWGLAEDYVDVADSDLAVPMSDAEVESMDSYLDSAEYDVMPADIGEFAEDRFPEPETLEQGLPAQLEAELDETTGTDTGAEVELPIAPSDPGEVMDPGTADFAEPTDAGDIDLGEPMEVYEGGIDFE